MRLSGWFERVRDETIGFFFAAYLKLLGRTNRFITVPADLDAVIHDHVPVIVAMWHGQHLMMTLAWPKSIRGFAGMVSRHADAGAQAVALRRLGVAAVRGSGGRADDIFRKGGVTALISLKRYLENGYSVAMTADVPKKARVAGRGIVTLARITGRPIAPIAVVTSRRLNFNTWDRLTIGMPFGRGAMVISDIIYVPPDADNEALEAARKRVEKGLDDAHRRAYALFGAKDPGADLRGQ